MDIRDLPVCSGCGANIRQGEECLNCGSSSNLTDSENSQNDAKLTDQPSVGFATHNSSVRSGINSLFDRLIPADADLLSSGHEVNSSISEKKISKLKIVFTSVLALIFLSFLSVNVYALVIKKYVYVEPVKVVSTESSNDIQKQIDELQLSSNSRVQKTLDFKMDLKSGNFDKTDFSMFADTNTNLLVEAFEFRHFTKNILDKGAIIDQLKKDLDMSDDDIDFYFSKEFAYIFPDNNFDRWGIVLSYKDDKFIDAKLAVIKKIKEGSKKNFYTDYVVEAFKIKEDRFILISNSKITLDQMKEFAEGNVQNLSKSAVYVDLIKDMPKLGSMFVYKKENTATWEYFINQAIKKYDKVQSLDVALKSIPSSVIVFSEDGEKTKIAY